MPELQTDALPGTLSPYYIRPGRTIRLEIGGAYLMRYHPTVPHHAPGPKDPDSRDPYRMLETSTTTRCDVAETGQPCDRCRQPLYLTEGQANGLKHILFTEEQHEDRQVAHQVLDLAQAGAIQEAADRLSQWMGPASTPSADDGLLERLKEAFSGLKQGRLLPDLILAFHKQGQVRQRDICLQFLAPGEEGAVLAEILHHGELLSEAARRRLALGGSAAEECRQPRQKYVLDLSKDDKDTILLNDTPLRTPKRGPVKVSNRAGEAAYGIFAAGDSARLIDRRGRNELSGALSRASKGKLRLEGKAGVWQPTQPTKATRRLRQALKDRYGT